jgi:ubiquinone/menaquinone biosynthesis C-methylase UbiE
MSDVFQVIDKVEIEKQKAIADRLEARAQMPSFLTVREAYFKEIDFKEFDTVLELGCGTGVVTRAIARRPDFKGEIKGSDLSSALIKKAQELASAEGLDDIEFFQADAQGSDRHEGAFDLVLAHTVLSHVEDPKALLAEAARLTRPGGLIVVHDGDYASMTFDTGAPEYDRVLPGKYLDAIVANRFVMRELPRLLSRAELKLEKSFGSVVVEAGQGEYFPTTIDSYGPIAMASGAVTKEQVEGWQKSCRAALMANAFFGSCNFLTYFVRKP